MSELEKAIYEFVDTRNQDPKPFIWLKSADEILARSQRLCGRLQVSQGSSRPSEPDTSG